MILQSRKEHMILTSSFLLEVKVYEDWGEGKGSGGRARAIAVDV